MDCLFDRNLTKTCRVQAMMKMQEDQRRIRIVELDEIQGSTSCGIFSTPEVFRVTVNAVDSYCLKALDSLSFRFSNVGTKGRAGGEGTLLHDFSTFQDWADQSVDQFKHCVGACHCFTSFTCDNRHMIAHDGIEYSI